MKYLNPLILCVTASAVFGANAAATYNRVGETTQTITITKPLELEATTNYRVQDDKAGGGAIVRTSDGSKADLYIGVGPSSQDRNNVRVVDTTSKLTLIGAVGCGGSGLVDVDTTATLSGVNSAAATCKGGTAISTLVSRMEPEKPEPGTYTFTQEYGTFVE